MTWTEGAAVAGLAAVAVGLWVWGWRDLLRMINPPSDERDADDRNA